MTIDPPLLTDTTHKLMDYAELRAHAAADRNVSASELRSDLSITGSEDALSEEETALDTTDQVLEGLIDAVFTEAEYRIKACGEERYPFQLQRSVLVSRDQDSSAIYTFLLLLSVFGENVVDTPDGAKLFEDVCAQAAAGYFGCSDPSKGSYVFGFPRRMAPGGFRDAVESLCKKTGEGQPDRKFPGAGDMKDAGLDVVVWREFPDLRSSKLIAFGQCATGQNWWDKRHELQPSGWCRSWLLKQPCLTPLKMFFVPHALSHTQWQLLSYGAEVLIFDRFRITHLAESAIPEALRNSLQEWNRKVEASSVKVPRAPKKRPPKSQRDKSPKT